MKVFFRRNTHSLNVYVYPGKSLPARANDASVSTSFLCAWRLMFKGPLMRAARPARPDHAIRIERRSIQDERPAASFAEKGPRAANRSVNEAGGSAPLSSSGA